MTAEGRGPSGCPECGAVAATYVMGMTTAMWFAPFRDDQGRMHQHDANTTTATWRCPSGHNYDTTGTGSCWCGWPETPLANRFAGGGDATPSTSGEEQS